MSGWLRWSNSRWQEAAARNSVLAWAWPVRPALGWSLGCQRCGERGGGIEAPLLGSRLGAGGEH